MYKSIIRDADRGRFSEALLHCYSFSSPAWKTQARTRKTLRFPSVTANLSNYWASPVRLIWAGVSNKILVESIPNNLSSRRPRSGSATCWFLTSQQKMPTVIEGLWWAWISKYLVESYRLSKFRDETPDAAAASWNSLDGFSGSNWKFRLRARLLQSIGHWPLDFCKLQCHCTEFRTCCHKRWRRTECYSAGKQNSMKWIL